MKHKWISLFLVLLTSLAFTNAAFAKSKIRVLLLSGDDVSAHNWQQMADATKQVLLASGKFEVTTAEQLTALESDTLTKASSSPATIARGPCPTRAKRTSSNL